MSIGFLKFPEIFYPIAAKTQKSGRSHFSVCCRLGLGSGNGADVSASAASDASIGNLVSHDSYLLHISTYVEVDVMIHLYTGVSQHLLITN